MVDVVAECDIGEPLPDSWPAAAHQLRVVVDQRQKRLTGDLDSLPEDGDFRGDLTQEIPAKRPFRVSAVPPELRAGLRPGCGGESPTGVCTPRPPAPECSQADLALGFPGAGKRVRGPRPGCEGHAPRAHAPPRPSVGFSRASLATLSGSATSTGPALPSSASSGARSHDYGLAPLRTRGLERVSLHADLVMLARLSQALARARPVPLAA